MAKGYNGHKNWNQWNVSLWINNDENLYHIAKYWVKRCRNRNEAAKFMLAELYDIRMSHTPDGAPFSVTAIRAAMVGL